MTQYTLNGGTKRYSLTAAKKIAEQRFAKDGVIVSIEAVKTPMKIPAVEHIETKGQAVEFAVAWQNWQSEQSLSWGEVAEWQEFFRKLADKFDLTEEFQENGIL